MAFQGSTALYKEFVCFHIIALGFSLHAIMTGQFGGSSYLIILIIILNIKNININTLYYFLIYNSQTPS